MKKVYEVLKKVPKGRITTYGELAGAGKTSPRAVGALMRANKNSAVPCHRVVCSDGSTGGFNKGIRKKIAMLRAEGVKIEKGKIKDFKKLFFRF